MKLLRKQVTGCVLSKSEKGKAKKYILSMQMQTSRKYKCEAMCTLL